jgi:hypothetical protein
MTNTKHTPLPWKIHSVTDKHHIQIRAKKAGTEFECSPAVLGGWDTSAEENEANAQFITRACNSHYELLEALRLLLEDSYNAIDNNNPMQIREATLIQSRAAIAKAKGEVC